MGLTITRCPGQRVLIGDTIWVTVVRVDGERVRLHVEAPPDVPIYREELLDRLRRTREPIRNPRLG